MVAVVGRARHPALAPAAHDYETRAARYWPLEVREVKEESGAASAPDVVRVREGRRLLECVPRGAHLVACDPGGRVMTSEAFSTWLHGERERGVDVCFVIGGAHGLSDDVRAAARHVGGDGHHLGPPGLCHDFRFARVLFGVQHVMRHTFFLQQRGKQFRVLNRRRAHQHRLAAFVTLVDIGNHRFVFFRRGLIHQVIHVLADHRVMRGDDHRLQAVNLLELVGFRVRCSGHAGELFIHAEIILEGNRRQRLIFLLDFHAFLGFDGLVKAF